MGDNRGQKIEDLLMFWGGKTLTQNLHFVSHNLASGAMLSLLDSTALRAMKQCCTGGVTTVLSSVCTPPTNTASPHFVTLLLFTTGAAATTAVSGFLSHPVSRLSLRQVVECRIIFRNIVGDSSNSSSSSSRGSNAPSSVFVVPRTNHRRGAS